MQASGSEFVFIEDYKSRYRLCQEQHSDVPKLSLVHLQLTKIPASLFQFNLLQSLTLDYNNIESIPGTFCDCLTNLTYLSLHGNDLLTLPTNFCKLKSLTNLLLNENSLEKLPDNFAELCELRELHLVGNNLQSLPANLGKLRNLKKLTLDENAIEYFPDSVGDLECLETLDARYNRLKEIPPTFGKLTSLSFLDLSHNNLSTIPDSFGELQHLQVLDLSFNKLTCLPPKCLFVETISKLFLEENDLTDVPEWFSQMISVVELSVKSNVIRGSPFTPDFGENLLKLKHFDFSGNFVESIPESFGCLRSLEFMDMGSTLNELERRRSLHNGNFLVRLPQSFGSLLNLQELHLDENQLEELPDSFGDLRYLNFVDLSHNGLKRLPESFCKLKNLVSCHLSINCLSNLPKEFGNLTKLEDLRLDNNVLEDLPESFTQLTKLETLDLFCNRLKVLPLALKYLTRLQRLDLLENDFGIPVLDVPNILVKSKYAPRNPDLVDNWRGKKRADILDFSYNQLSPEVGTNGDSTMDDADSLQRLAQALKSGAAIRRKHGEMLDGFADEEIEEDRDDYLDGGTHFHSSDQKDESDIEPWDSHIIADNPYGIHANYYLKPPASIKADGNVFVPSDIHAPPMQHTNTFFAVMEGQFDNAD